MKYIFIISLIILLANCSGDQTPKTDTLKDKAVNANVNIDIASAINSKEINLNLTEIASNVEYIKLETTDKSLLSEIQNIVISDLIFIKDKHGIYKFSLNGKFIKKIGEYGKGPKEYLACSNYFAYNDDLYIFDYMLHNVHRYSSDGEYKDRIKFPQGAFSVFFIINNTFYFFNDTPLEFWGEVQPDWVVTTMDINTKKVTRIFDKYNKPRSCEKSYIFNNDLHVKQLLNDTVYKVKGNELVPSYTIHFGKYKPKSTVNKSGIKGPPKIKLRGLAEDSNAIYCNAQFDGKFHGLVYLKKTGNTIKLKNKLLTNDIDNGVDFWPNFISNGKLIHVVDYTSIEDHLKYQPDNAELQKMAKYIEMGNNPILMIAK